MAKSKPRPALPPSPTAADTRLLKKTATSASAPALNSDLQAKLLPERYGMRENPFGMTPNPGYFYPTWTHREALSSLITGLECGAGFLALIAPPGMGKTTLLFQLLERYREQAATGFLFNLAATPELLLRQLVRELDVSGASDSALTPEEQLHAVLLREFHGGRRCIVVVDESQNLGLEVLEALRMVSNFETSHSKLLHIILSGQPQLADKLADPRLAQLRQRISLIARLAPLGPEETAMYIAHRLELGGYQGPPLFTPAAVQAIWEHSQGIPRVINTVCFNALLLGGSFDAASIGTDIVGEAIADLDITRVQRPRPSFAVGPLQAKGIAAASGTVPHEDSALAVLAERAVVAVDAAGIAVLVKQGNGFVRRAASGVLRTDAGVHLPPSNSDLQRCLQALTPVEGYCGVRPGTSGAQVARSIYVPVCNDGRPLAVLEAVALPKSHFTPVHVLKLKAIADEIRLLLASPAPAEVATAAGPATCASPASIVAVPQPTAMVEPPANTACEEEVFPAQPLESAETPFSHPPAERAPLPPPALLHGAVLGKQGASRRNIWISAAIMACVAALGLGVAWYARVLGRGPERAEAAPPAPILEGLPASAFPAGVSEILRMAPAPSRPKLTSSAAAARPAVASTIAEPSRAILMPHSSAKAPEAENAVSPPPLGASSEPALNLVSSAAAMPAHMPAPSLPEEAQPPQVLYREKPVYPVAARARKLEGNIPLEVVVAKDGTVLRVRALAGPALLAKAAENAVTKWRFSPRMRDDGPQESTTRVFVKFVLRP